MSLNQHHQRGAPLVLAAAVAVVSGCNFIVEPDRVQCDTNADCAARGASFENTECVRSMCVKVDPLWGCLDRPQTPAVNNGPYKVIVRTTFIVGSAPVPGSSLNLCNRIDTDCVSPLNPEPVVTNENGEGELSVNHNFTGYVQVIPPDVPGKPEVDQYVPGYYFFNPGVTTEMNVGVQLATFGLVTALTGLLEATQREDRGLALINVLSCEGTGAPGVVFKSDGTDDETVTFYAQGSLPVKGLTATEVAGFGGFVNLNTGLRSVSGEIVTSGRPMNSVALIVKPQAITYTRLVPIGLPP